MRHYISALVIYIIPVFLFFSSASAQDILPPKIQAQLELEWGERIDSYMEEFKTSRNKTAVLEQVNRVIFREFEKNILHPPILNKKHTAEKRKNKFARLIKAMADIQDKSGDKYYMDYILLRLSTKIFGVQEHKNKIVLSSRKLKWKRNLFKGMDEELRAAVFETDDLDIVYTFYTKFYFPLIKIDNFLNHIYEYDDQRPYEDFIDKFDRKRLEASFKELQVFLLGLDFVNVETPLNRLLIYYYKKRGVNIWENPDILLSKNINIPIFVDILKAHKRQHKESHNYKAILTKLLDHLDDKDYLIRKVRFKARSYHSSMTFFNFIYNNVLLPWEVKKYPFKDKDGNLLSLDELIDKKGRIIIDSEDNIVGRKKVSGNLRQQFCDKLLKFDLLQIFGSQAQMDADFSFRKLAQQQQSYVLKNVFAAIFLPNSTHNNADDGLTLYKYNKSKLELFLKLKKALAKTQDSRLSGSLLKSVLRLNKSYRSGFLQMPFYIVTNDLYREYFDKLWDREKKMLILERLKLGLSSKRIEGENNLRIYFSDLTSTTNDLIETYKITPPPINNLSDVITYRATSGNQEEKIKRIKELGGDEKMFFLISNLRNLFSILSNRRYMAPADARNIYLSINNILDIYQHYFPFFSNIDPASVIENKNALLLMALLNKNDIKYPFTIMIKYPYILLNRRLQDATKFPQDETIKLLRQKIVSKLIMHNFTACELIFHALENNKAETLNVSTDVKYKLLDFDLLNPVNETRKIVAKNLIEDTLASFALNLGLLKDADESYVFRYIFGDVDLQGYGPAINTQIISCFDYIIRRALKTYLADSSEPSKQRITRFILDQTKNFPEVYTYLSSATGIQKLWEMTLVNIVKEKSNKAFFEKYNNFYMKGNFIKGETPQQILFREDIEKTFVKKFYAEDTIDLEKFLSRFDTLCHGTKGSNWGLMGIIDKHKTTDLEYLGAYRSAVVELMKKTFVGKGLPPKKWYIGQMFYDNQEDQAIPIADSDIFSDEFFRTYEWIWDAAVKSADYPEVRGIFVDDDTWGSYTKLQ